MRTIAAILLALSLFISQSHAEAPIKIGLTLTTEANERFDKLVFGIDPNATLGIDNELGEADLPPFWPPNQMHAFLVIQDPLTNEEYVSYKNFKPFPKGDDKYYTEYKFEFNPYSGDTLTIAWSMQQSNIDSAFFAKPYAGSDLFSINMKLHSSYSLIPRDLGVPLKALFRVWFAREPSKIEEIDNNQALMSIYPNPADNVLTLRNIRVKSRYMIYNLLGEVAQSGDLGEGMDQVNITNIQTGYYYIKIADNYGNQQISSFIKK